MSCLLWVKVVSELFARAEGTIYFVPVASTVANARTARIANVKSLIWLRPLCRKKLALDCLIITFSRALILHPVIELACMKLLRIGTFSIVYLA